MNDTRPIKSGEAKQPTPVVWTVLDPETFASRAGASFKKLPDKIIPEQPVPREALYHAR
jgi:hypothetical protein